MRARRGIVLVLRGRAPLRSTRIVSWLVGMLMYSMLDSLPCMLGASWSSQYMLGVDGRGTDGF